MAHTAGIDRVTAIVLRLMRTPILLLIAVSAVTVFGMVLVPGPEVDGKATHMSFFHAVYFLTYTATTTGFGEIPYEFSNAQRLWAIFSLIISVVAWVYAIGSIIGLFQNPYFRQAVAEERFARMVRRISEPFYIVCGFGDTGSLLTRGLSDAGFTVSVIDIEENRIQALALRNYPATMPGLCADAGVPGHLIAAGLQQTNCRGVVALTNDEGINRKIVIMARLINPSVRAVCRSTSHVEEEFLSSLGSVDVIDPFDVFAQQLSTALHRPSLHTLSEWLAGAHGVSLAEPLRPPTGKWLVCGFGRMGKSLLEALSERRIPTVVIDPGADPSAKLDGLIVGHANARTLSEAGIERAVGIVAATNSDSNNLGILLSARTLNPRIFLVVRQNRHDDEVAFEAANADLIMQPSLVAARKILLLLVSPLVQTFLDFLQEARVPRVVDTIRRFRQTVGDELPHLWTVEVTQEILHPSRSSSKCDGAITLDTLMRDSLDRSLTLPCVPLVLQRWRQTTALPREMEILHVGDQILFCGTARAQRHMEAALRDPYIRHYLLTGEHEAHGAFMRWAQRKWNGRRGGAKKESRRPTDVMPESS